MLPSVALDPSAFWVFEECHSKEDFVVELLERTLEWMRPRSNFEFDLFISQNSIAKLEEFGKFPAEPYFTRLLKSADLDHVVTPRQLAANVARFLASNPSIEDNHNISDAAFDAIGVEPDLIKTIVDQNLRQVSSDTLGLVALSNFDQTKTMFAFNCCQSSVGSVDVTITNPIVEAKIPRTEFPEKVIQEVLIIRRPSDYAGRLKSSEIWELADSVDEIYLAIRLEAEKLSREASTQSLNFSIGQNFIKSLKECEALNAQEYASVVRIRCAQVVASLEGIEVNDFYTSTKKSHVRIRKSDNARAKRVHVTLRHQALRLMFWLKKDGSIEFANIGNKAEEHIYD